MTKTSSPYLVVMLDQYMNICSLYPDPEDGVSKHLQNVSYNAYISMTLRPKSRISINSESP
jgi:hypothetical protein